LVACVWATSDAPRAWQVRHLLEPICREGRLHGMGSLDENQAWLERAGLTVSIVQDLSRQVRPTWTRVARSVAGSLLRNPVYRRYVLDRRSSERVFALTVPRLWLAYRTGALRYGFLVAKKRGVED
jgi:tocopherol O-methyltransferase